MGFLNKRRLGDHAPVRQPGIALHNQTLRFGRRKSIPLSPRGRLPVSEKEGHAARRSLHLAAFDVLPTNPATLITNVARATVFCDCAAHKFFLTPRDSQAGQVGRSSATG
jgi:hypothetical protein